MRYSDPSGQLETALATAGTDSAAAAAVDLSTIPGDLSATPAANLSAAPTSDLGAAATSDLTAAPTSDLIGPNDLTPIQVAATASGQDMPALVSWLQSASGAVPRTGIRPNMVMPALVPVTHAHAPHHMTRVPAGPGARRQRHAAMTVMPSAAVAYSSTPGVVVRRARAVARPLPAAGHRHVRAAPSASTASIAWSPRTVIALDSGGSAAGAVGGVGSGMTAMVIFMALGIGLLELFSSRLSLDLEPWRSAMFPSRLERPG